LVRVSIVLLAWAAAAVPAEFQNGQAARLVIGQPSFTAERPISSREALGGAGGVGFGGGRLFIADSNRMGAGPINHRVLIYDAVSAFIPAPDAEIRQGSTCPACVGIPVAVLGQTDFDAGKPGLENGLNLPTAVASDGVRLAVADTDNNRVLIWRTIPTVNGTPPDVVVGQPDLKTNLPKTDQTGLRGPQGVWFHDGKLIIADTQNSRVLIYNSIPTSNGARADLVLGQPDFNTRPSADLTVSNVRPTASSMLNPVSATTSGNRLFVADLGFNRVLIYNSIPTANNAAADVVLGQPNMESAISNNSTKDSNLCAPTHQDEEGKDVYPTRCAATLSFPRAVLSDGTRLYVADGGNDRVLIFNRIPTQNGAAADVVLGQRDFFVIEENNGTGTLRAPSALAHDGVNLYVADPFSRRILVFTPGEHLIRTGGIVNAASFAVHSQGSVTLEGALKNGDEVTIKIGGREYKYKAGEEDTLQTIRDAFVRQINEDPGDPLVYARGVVGEGTYALGSITFGGEIQAGDVVTVRIQNRFYRYRIQEDDTPEGLVYHFTALIRDQGRDPDAFADPDPSDPRRLRLTARFVGPRGDDINYEVSLSPGAAITAQTEGDYLFGGNFKQVLLFVARQAGAQGNNIELSASVSTNSTVVATTSSTTLTGGNDATEAPQGTQIAIFGENLAPEVAVADASQEELPRELAGTQVYINGIRAPLYLVSPTQINAQVPFELEGTSMSVYVRSRRSDGSVAVSVSRPVKVTRAAPGLYAYDGPEPRAGVVLHGMEFSRGTVAIDNSSGTTDQSVPAGILVEITVNDRKYEYTTVEGDTTDSVRDKMVGLINAGDGDPDVIATTGRVGFLSARARVTLEGKAKEGEVLTIAINGRSYRYTVRAGDNLRTIANRIIAAINSPPGDPDVTARLSSDVGIVAIDIIARSLGVQGNSITLIATTSPSVAELIVKNDAKDDKLGGGSTPAVVILTARRPGREGDDIRYSAFVPGGSAITAVAQTTNLCCGNDLYSPVTPQNPAVPGEKIIVFGTGLGLTTPRNGQEGLETGKRTPREVPFLVPLNPDDFVSSLAGGKTASVDFVGLMPGAVGIYEVDLILNSDLPDNPMTPLTIAQGLFVSNIITFPVQNRVPRRSP
jgi:uncharacterized protein (TIGR03437 family)